MKVSTGGVAMQSEKIVLIPPTHEQSTPSFHVEAGLMPDFSAYLADHGVHVIDQPPEPLGPMGPRGCMLEEIEIEEGTPMDRLETLMDQYLEERHLVNVE
jgi:hypothetical protein